MKKYKSIPYGIASYKTIRQDNCYYVDKTSFIPEIEGIGKFLFLIRPRRFGKSSFLTVLESYYDISRKEEFDFLFGGTWISKNPTPEKNTYLVLKFNFSQVSPVPEEMENSFEGHTANCFFFFGKRYRDYLDEDYFEIMQQHPKAHQKLEFLLRYAGSKDLKVYIMIDEYDNFTNTVLTTAGQETYHEITHGAGFFRFFFNVLKGAGDQMDSGLGRLFITGVSPVTMDDVTSGFNIGMNISLLPECNELLGFTEQDVKDLLHYYDIPAFDAGRIMELMKEWYDGYRFSPESGKAMFNTDMVLYFMNHFLRGRKFPASLPYDMIDQNVKIDYGKLRHLMVLDRKLNGNFSHLSDIIMNQETGITKVTGSFPVAYLKNPDNFVSLLFYLGLLSYSKQNKLQIPNQTVTQLMYSYLRDGYRDTDVFALDFHRFGNLIRSMACNGEWEPVFRFLAGEVEKQTSVRDYLEGEKVIQTFLLAYLNITDYYLTRSEEEMGKGFADLYLEPFSARYPEVKYCYLIELKYMKRSEFSEEKMNQQLNEAGEQLKKYAADRRIAGKNKKTELKCLAMVFSGWELKTEKEIYT